MHGQYAEINGKEEEKYTRAFSKDRRLILTPQIPSPNIGDD